MTHETADRIFELMRDIRLWDAEHDALDHRAVANTIAAEIDALTRERDEARAAIERLRPAAEAWIAYDDYMMCPENEKAAKFPVWIAAHKAAKSAQVARAAKGTP